MKTLFVCQTPLHFLLATLLMQAEKKETTFVWVEECAIAYEFVKNIININNAKLVKLEGSYNKNRKIKRTLQKLSNIRVLKKLHQKNNFNELIVFNDLTPETQFLINEIDNTGGHVSLGEDGVALYEISGSISVNLLNKHLGKLVYGQWWSSKDKIGLNHRIKTVYAFSPEYVRNEISSSKTVLCIPQFDMRLFLEIREIKILPINISEKFILFILPLSDDVGLDEIRSLIIKISALNIKMALKFHPREHDDKIQETIKYMDTLSYILLPNDIPAEIVCMTASPPLMVIGYRSSSLHIIRSLFKEIQVRYIELSFDKDSDKWELFYKNMDIKELYKY